MISNLNIKKYFIVTCAMFSFTPIMFGQEDISKNSKGVNGVGGESVVYIQKENSSVVQTQSADCELLPSTVDGSFTSCTNVASNTSWNNNVTCGGWLNVSPTTADTWKVPLMSPSALLNNNIPASPDGGAFAGAIGHYVPSSPGVPESFKTTISSLVPGQQYSIAFYQSNMTKPIAGTSGAVRWQVKFGSQILLSDNSPVQEFPSWSLQTLVFTPTATTQELMFTAFPGTYVGTHNYLYAVIDGVTVKRLNYDCENPEPPCVNCTSFDLIKKEKYLISGWVKEEDTQNPQAQYKNYSKAFISITFKDVSGAVIGTEENFFASGEIIDGWQRIIGEFRVPVNVDDMIIELNNADASKMAYFDDIRVLPTKGNMKSFVYDQETQRLMAELDENNYSTFYEYDLEGGLIRVKKETEKGVFTIQESRSGNKKSAN